MVNLKKKSCEDEKNNTNLKYSNLDVEQITCTDGKENLKSTASTSFVNPLLGFSQQQCAEHYDNCIKLAASNKINQHNAFHLHLIDHINGLVNRGEVSSFQMASSSLDAGAKIYAGRVDALHSGIYKVLDGLTGKFSKVKGNSDSSNEQPIKNDEEVDPLRLSVSEAHNSSKSKRRHRTSTCLIPAIVLNKIRLKSSALRFDVDPMFEKQAAAYDKDRSDYLRLNKISVCADDCELQLDSNAGVMSGALGALLETKAPSSRTYLTPTLHKQLHDINMQLMNLQLCSTFSNFLFSEGQDDIIDDVDDLKIEVSSCGMQLTCTTTRVDEVSTNYIESCGNLDSCRFVSDLRGFMSKQLIDCHGRQDDLLDLWVGPERWKRQLVTTEPHSDLDVTCNPAAQGKTLAVRSCKRRATKSTKKRGFKLVERVDFRLQAEWRRTFAVKRASISKSTLEERHLKQQQHVLPLPQIESDVKLFNLMNKDDVVVVDWLNRDNDESIEQDDYELLDAIDRLSPFTSMDLSIDTVDLDAYAMLESPKKTNILELNYVRKAKCIDVKALKLKMWTHLCMKDEKLPSVAAAVDDSKMTGMRGEKRFGNLLASMVANNDDGMLGEDLSVPVLFSCLLHLANEKTLFLEDVADYTDLKITQSILHREVDLFSLYTTQKRRIFTTTDSSTNKAKRVKTDRH